MHEEPLTSKAVERLTDYSGPWLRRIVRKGVVTPRKDASGRFLYSMTDVQKILAWRDSRRHRQVA